MQRRGAPYLGVVADSGQMARIASQAGADFLVALSAGVFRSRGIFPPAALLPFQNSNRLMEELLFSQILPRAGSTPVWAGILAGDPTFPLEQSLERLRAAGVVGVLNYPSSSTLDGSLRTIYEDQGCTLEAEMELLRSAKKLGLQAMAFCQADAATALAFANSGVDAIILTPGVTRELEDVHEKRDQLQLALRQIQDALRLLRANAPHLPCLVYGGPITLQDDLEQVYRQTDLDGFVGGSVFGRLPIEAGVSAMVRRFKAVAAPRESTRQSGMGAILGTSPVMCRLFQLIERASACDLSIYLEGESGVGKELVASQIHRLGNRAHGPWVTLNCGAIPDTLLESELFGHERGAFTGAQHRRLGKFELADRGTLFLDEVADLSSHAQVALLRAIQQREITRVGGNTSIKVDHRIITASNQPLARLVEQGRFRADLYYRLNQLTLHVPPLRERIEDLPELVRSITNTLRVQVHREKLEVSPTFLKKLAEHGWPGNIRELQHVLSQAALLEDGPTLQGTHFIPQPWVAVVKHPERDRRARVEQALANARGNKSRAAQALGVSRKTLYEWLRELK